MQIDNSFSIHYDEKRCCILGMPKPAKKIIQEVSEGLLSSVVDCSLWFIVYTAALSVPQSSYGQLYRAQREADRFLDAINYESLKRSIAEARRRGLIKRVRKGSRSWPQITKAGKMRLAAMLPKYDKERVWDKRIYVVTYDIPEEKRKERDLLREHLRLLGCGKLQESVYMTPYDPRELLARYVREHHVSGTIIVSDIGKDGSIGEKTLEDLVCDVYHLHNLNDRYEEWLVDIDGKTMDHFAAIRFLSILKDDPQLPFALLPNWWQGDRAYKRIEKVLKSMVI